MGGTATSKNTVGEVACKPPASPWLSRIKDFLGGEAPVELSHLSVKKSIVKKASAGGSDCSWRTYLDRKFHLFRTGYTWGGGGIRAGVMVKIVFFGGSYKNLGRIHKGHLDFSGEFRRKHFEIFITA